MDRPKKSEDFLIFLQQGGTLSAPSANRIASALSASGQPFDTVVTELGLLRDEELAKLLNAFLENPPVDEVPLEQVSQARGDVSLNFLREQAILPLAINDVDVMLGVADPFATPAIEALAFYLERTASLRAMPRRLIHEQLAQFDSSSEGATPTDGGTPFAVEEDLERLKDFASEAPIVRFVTETITRAVDQGATDIHIEPFDDSLRIRYRHDGMLTTVNTVPLSMLAGVATRIKILSRLNIAERRLPQDGRMRIPVRGRDVDLRVSVVPSVHGETIVLRILDRATIELKLDKLGFDMHAQQIVAGMAQAANGIVLVTGPTGSGKTTTLYSVLSEYSRPDRKVFTVEDPVEYRLNGITQLQVDPAIDLDFATALRSVLRQDPDTILIGEIRDRETAQIAIQAALTGHLVLSTLHTNSATGALTRLRDMGIEGYLLGSTIRGVIAQRLLRRLCNECHGAALKQNRDCPRCTGSGYRGRTVTYELLRVSADMAALIDAGGSEAEIAKAAILGGMVPMHEHAMSLVSDNITTIDEVSRVLDYGGD